MKESIIELNNIVKKYNDIKVLNEVSFNVYKNEFVTLLGPSGCGKTTTLRIIGGFEKANEGSVSFEGENINDIPPYKRQINTVFQNYALFPHMNVFENIAFGLKIKKLNTKIIEKKVKRILKLVGLEKFEKREIDSLSGGQQQRIAIARALVNEPKVLLLDEPLGALDLKLRKDMQVELKNIQKTLGITFIYVTHDQEEALTMSDRIIVMKSGNIQQIGSPINIYNEPVNSFVADFIGESNIISGIMKDDYQVNFLGKVFECVDYGFKKMERVNIVIRPEDIDIVKKDTGLINGEIKSVVFKGVHYEIVVLSKNFEFLIQSTKTNKVGNTVGLDFNPDDIHVMREM
ncbi:MAG: ABC transporter ATP-binding protein [Bacillota bacterium]|nr:ABC transporter ATP-binding protein [Bacillota bacterium]